MSGTTEEEAWKPRRSVTRKGIVFCRNVPLDIKAQFKAYCARRGVTMNDALVYLMEEATRNQRKIIR